MSKLLLTILTLVGLTPGVQAQAIDDVRPGARIRLSLQGAGKPLTGTLEAVFSDTVRLRDTTGALIAVAKPEIQRAEVSYGRRGHNGKGALVGLLLGGGAAVALAGSCDCNQTAFAVVFGVIMGSAGAGFGALVGGAAQTEAWEELVQTAGRRP
jgi:hypothetical protein